MLYLYAFKVVFKQEGKNKAYRNQDAEFLIASKPSELNRIMRCLEIPTPGSFVTIILLLFNDYFATFRFDHKVTNTESI